MDIHCDLREHLTENNHNNQASVPECDFSCVSFVHILLTVGPMMAERATGSVRLEEGAPAPLVAATRADDRAHGVGRSLAPLCVQRCRARDERRIHEARRRSIPGRMRCSSSYATKTPQGDGHPVWVSGQGRKNGYSGTPVEQIIQIFVPVPALDVPMCRSRWSS